VNGHSNGSFPIVVIGGSAGSLEPLERIARDLPADFEAAVFVTTHTPADSVSALPHLLARRGSLFASHALDRAPIEPGRIVIAPPDRHLVFSDGVMRVIDGPMENRSRPSIDVMFRSAASFGSRTCGVLLSGTLDDGVAGLVAIHDSGGATFVQSPDDAHFPEMPQNALNTGRVDRVLPASEIVAAIESWIASPHPSGAPHPIADEREAGMPSVFTCPDCGGTLWEADDGATLRFRCRVGHAFTGNTMLAQQGDTLESALWAAARALEERRDLLRRMARRSVNVHATRLPERLEQKAGEVQHEIDRLTLAITRLSARESAPVPQDRLNENLR
jgi:two-component system chemotaxis response regulator CheB